MIIGDIETDGLLDIVTKVHCASFYNLETGIWNTFTPDNMDELISFLDSCPEVSGHNFIGFDLPALKKIYGYEYKGKVTDTLLMSRILFPDIDKMEGVKAGPHSVEAWGVRFNYPKPEHENWTQFSEEMLHRNKTDVEIQTRIYKFCLNHLKKLGIDNIDQVMAVETRVWKLMEEQAENGWQFDVLYAQELVKQLTAEIEPLEYQLIEMLPMRTVKPYKETACKAFKANGELTVNAANWVQDRFEDVAGDFSRVLFEKMNPGSDKQIKPFMLEAGWQPKEWNYKKDKYGKPIRDENFKLILTSPKLPKTVEDWDEVVEQTHNPTIKLLAHYNKANHRKSQIQGLLDNVREDGRVSARANSCSTNTARMVHRVVVNIPKAKDHVYYGKQMRAMFIAAPGKILVGADASALEARCEAHYIWNLDRANALELIDGDIHTKNADVFHCNRDIAKNGKYAIGYGCGVAKLASTIGCSKEEAKQLLGNYWDNNPGLKELKAILEHEFEEKGYITAIDGRPLSVRYKHALINTLFQSCGSIIMKYALIILDKKIRCAILKGCKFVGNFHDEWIVECNPEDAETVAKLSVESIEQAGRILKINVPITGEAKIGHSWAETH